MTALPPFQAVLDEHREDVYRFLVALAGRQEADDCFQETLMSAIRAYPKLDPAADGRAWLFTIARRKAVDSHRARGRRAIPVDSVPEATAPSNGTGPDPELWGLVRALPPKQRAAVALRFVADLSHAEVGAALDCSEEAARRNLHEGIARLREEWVR
ncbi:MAG TPA: sigma-70 family RNA polymerase sigma factor [Solirubrobacteraceae bacterium]|nr:sigma-70 family RNA polymerase sigma factor [Solirubrobacteraceae bacterium]